MDLDIITFVMLSVKIRNFSSHYKYIKNTKRNSDFSKPLISCHYLWPPTRRFCPRFVIDITTFVKFWGQLLENRDAGEVTGKVVSSTLKQVRALRIIRIIAQGKIWRFGTKTWNRYLILKLYRSPVITLQKQFDFVKGVNTRIYNLL